MKKTNWNEVEEASDFSILPAGGYICKILRVEDVEDKEFLIVEYDIAYGDSKDYFTQQSGYTNFWGGTFYKSYKDKAKRFFKSFLTAIEESNNKFSIKDWDCNPKGLEKLYIGLTIGHEKYWNKNGDERIRPYVDKTLSVESIRLCKYKEPELKVNEYNKPKPVTINDSDFIELSDDCPFA